MPLNAKHFIDPKKTISCFRTSKEIFLYRPPQPLNTYELKASIETKIGGLMGLGGSVCKTTVIFDKNQYYNGDTCNVKIICDNSQCSTGVKSFKIKLKRKVYATGEKVSVYSEKDD